MGGLLRVISILLIHNLIILVHSRWFDGDDNRQFSRQPTNNKRQFNRLAPGGGLRSFRRHGTFTTVRNGNGVRHPFNNRYNTGSNTARGINGLSASSRGLSGSRGLSSSAFGGWSSGGATTVGGFNNNNKGSFGISGGSKRAGGLGVGKDFMHKVRIYDVKMDLNSLVQSIKI